MRIRVYALDYCVSAPAGMDGEVLQDFLTQKLNNAMSTEASEFLWTEVDAYEDLNANTSECPKCRKLVAWNWITRHYESDCKMGVLN